MTKYNFFTIKKAIVVFNNNQYIEFTQYPKYLKYNSNINQYDKIYCYSNGDARNNYIDRGKYIVFNNKLLLDDMIGKTMSINDNIFGIVCHCSL